LAGRKGDDARKEVLKKPFEQRREKKSPKLAKFLNAPWIGVVVSVFETTPTQTNNDEL
jgi:hypothetical protein